MSDAAARFPYPPDDPSAIAGIRSSFRSLAAAAGDVHTRLGSDLTALRHGWSGDAANACGREVTANHHLVDRATRALADTDRAVAPYQRAVELARHDIDAVRARYAHAAAEHEARRDAEDTQWQRDLTNLTAAYEGALAAVQRAARKARADLEAIGERVGPQVRPGRGDLSVAVRLGVNRGLPLARAAMLDQDAAHVTDLLGRAARGDTAAQQELALYTLEATDPAFATALAQQLGADGFLTLPATMKVTSEDGRRANAAVLGFLSSVLATATDGAQQPHVSDAWLAELTGHGRTVHKGPKDYWGYWGLAQILGAAGKEPPYSSRFMATVGRDLLDFTRQPPRWPLLGRPFEPGAGGLNAPGGPALPGDGTDALGRTGAILVNLVHAAGTSDVAAQALFDHADNLDWLFHYKHWPDGGDELGNAVELAGTGPGTEPARIASMAVHSYADVMRSAVDHGDGTISVRNDPLPGLRDSIGRTVAAHIDDVNTALLTRGEETPDRTDGTHPHFSRSDLAYALLGAERDPAGYDAVLRAQLAHMRLDFDHAAADPDDNAAKLAAVINRAKANGETLGFLLEARSQGLIGSARADDQARGRLADYVDMGIGLVAPPPHIGNIDQFGTILTDHIRTHDAANSYEKVSTYWEQADAVTRQMIESTVTQHHLWGTDDPVTTAPVGASFLDHSTRPPTLIPQERMTPQQYEAFRTWEAGSRHMSGVLLETRDSSNSGSMAYKRVVGVA